LSRSFKFVRFDAALQPLADLNLRCLDASDALLVGGRLGWRVEVWDGVRALGVVGEGALDSTSAFAACNPANRNEAVLEPGSPAACAIAAAIQPIALPETPPAYQTPLGAQRAYNPFRKGAWQRRPSGREVPVTSGR
jgi:hypothetical protein